MQSRQEAVAYDFASALVSGGVLPELTYRAANESPGALCDPAQTPSEFMAHGCDTNRSIYQGRIDNAKTRVYSRDTGLFSTPDPNLESEVREEAERQLQQGALQDGILKTAADNARSTLSGMLQGLGFHEVDIH